MLTLRQTVDQISPIFHWVFSIEGSAPTAPWSPAPSCRSETMVKSRGLENIFGSILFIERGLGLFIHPAVEFGLMSSFEISQNTRDLEILTNTVLSASDGWDTPLRFFLTRRAFCWHHSSYGCFHPNVDYKRLTQQFEQPCTSIPHGASGAKADVFLSWLFVWRSIQAIVDMGI